MSRECKYYICKTHQAIGLTGASYNPKLPSKNNMTKQQEKTAYIKHLEQARREEKEAAMFRERRERLEQDQRDYEEFEKNRAAFTKRLEEARNKKTPEPVKKTEPVKATAIGCGPSGIFPEVFLQRCAELYKNKLYAFVEKWVDAANDYLDWLENEGFTRGESVEILNAELEKANLDLSKFPVCV
jgi:hypothetical protein